MADIPKIVQPKIVQSEIVQPETVEHQIIDAHHHLWSYSAEDYGWIGADMEVLQRDFLAEDIEQEMHTAGVDGSVVVQARQSLRETEWLIEVAAAAECILGVVGWVPLSDPDIDRVLRRFIANKSLKGVRHVVQDEPDDDFILRNDFNRGVAALLDTGLVYDILIHEQHLRQTIAFVRQHPGQTFVLDHLAKPRVRHQMLQPWRDNLKRLAENPNVYCKLSGLVTEAEWSRWNVDQLRPYLDVALGAFGPERLMAGSDWPVCLVASSYKQWWSVLHEWCRSLPAVSRALILGGTASRVYQLADK